MMTNTGVPFATVVVLYLNVSSCAMRHETFLQVGLDEVRHWLDRSLPSVF